jgi:hypothetical protein
MCPKARLPCLRAQPGHPAPFIAGGLPCATLWGPGRERKVDLSLRAGSAGLYRAARLCWAAGTARERGRRTARPRTGCRQLGPTIESAGHLAGELARLPSAPSAPRHPRVKKGRPMLTAATSTCPAIQARGRARTARVCGGAARQPRSAVVSRCAPRPFARGCIAHHCPDMPNCKPRGLRHAAAAAQSAAQPRPSWSAMPARPPQIRHAGR